MLKRFISYYRPYKKLFLLDFISAIIAALLELCFPLVVRYVIDKILPNNDFSVVAMFAAALFGLYIFNTTLKYVVVYFGHKLGVLIANDMREELFAHYQKQSFHYFDNVQTGQLMSRLTNDLFEISELAHHGPEDMFVTVMTIIGAFILMLQVHVKLAILTVTLVPTLIIIILVFSKKMTKINTEIYEKLGSFNAGVENILSGIRVVKAFANEEHEKKHFGKLIELYKQSRFMFYKTMGISSALNYLVVRLVNLFALIFGAYFTIHDNLSVGVLVGYILLTNIFVKPIELINVMLEMYPKGIAGFKRFCESLDHQPDIVDKENALTVTHLNGDIIYNDVSFRYDESQIVLENFNLKIKKGEKVALVGPSGAGKSTICNLLPRFYQVSSGNITIDNINIEDMTMKSLRKQIGIVQQDVFLFAGTIKENILYGKLEASDEEVWAAIEHAHLTDVIKNMPEGLDTQIGERGVRLSGGQKQRVAIARIFLKNPAVLILDEATSALDTHTEKVIQQSFEELSTGRTTLIIAHRLATIQHADRIIFVTKDGIAEEGTHEQLMSKKGPYYELYTAQFR